MWDLIVLIPDNCLSINLSLERSVSFKTNMVNVELTARMHRPI